MKNLLPYLATLLVCALGIYLMTFDIVIISIAILLLVGLGLFAFVGLSEIMHDVIENIKDDIKRKKKLQ